jgi:processive 1,2-diacylglycerol beta-glucosyltransferase
LLEKLARPVGRVLIITGSAGGGHVSAACALKEEAAVLGLDCEIVDALNASKFFRFSTQSLYEAFVRLAPRLWGAFYDLLERNKYALGMHTRFTTASLGQLEQVIGDYRPDWIICTHDVALPKIASLRRYPHNFQLAVTVTDVHPHVLWIEGSADAGAELIFVSCDESKADILHRSQIPSDRIIVSGIPIGSAFTKRKPIVHRSAISALPTILITSGMIGAGRYLDVVKALAGLDVRVRLVVVCGRNQTIHRKLKKLARHLKRTTQHEFIIRGRVEREEMASLLHTSAILVGKPGGLTMSESLAASCPFVIYEPFLIPGQEQKNAEFLVANGIGVRAANPSDLQKKVQQLMTDGVALERMRANAQAHGKPYAAHEILQKMLEPAPTPVSV